MVVPLIMIPSIAVNMTITIILTVDIVETEQIDESAKQCFRLMKPEHAMYSGFAHAELSRPPNAPHQRVSHWAWQKERAR